MRIAICDNEITFLSELKALIYKSYSNIDKLIISEFTSGEEFLKEFSPMKFDVIILDIEMNELSGLKVAEKIRRVDNSVIIAFMTSHQEFALNGYEVKAFRYLLKGQPEPMYIKQLSSIFDEYHQTHLTFSIRMQNTVFSISVIDIFYFEIFNRTVILHARDKEYKFTGKLSDIENDERLVNFVKPHKSYYVNLAHIDNIEATSLIMKNGDGIPLSRGFRQSVTNRFILFLAGRC